jgi:hypothetical protein
MIARSRTMTVKISYISNAISMSILSAIVLLASPAHLLAAPNVVPVEGAQFTINASMSQNLEFFTGKRINITLDSGTVISGIVKDVGDHMLHLEKLSGKEYYDALIQIEDISAFDSRFRTIQR